MQNLLNRYNYHRAAHNRPQNYSAMKTKIYSHGITPSDKKIDEYIGQQPYTHSVVQDNSHCVGESAVFSLPNKVGDCSPVHYGVSSSNGALKPKAVIPHDKEIENKRWYSLTIYRPGEKLFICAKDGDAHLVHDPLYFDRIWDWAKQNEKLYEYIDVCL